jgi:hypothetical protein
VSTLTSSIRKTAAAIVAASTIAAPASAGLPCPPDVEMCIAPLFGINGPPSAENYGTGDALWGPQPYPGMPYPLGLWTGAQHTAPPYQPQIVPVLVPFAVPVQPQASASQPVQCSINQVPALTKSEDDCEKAGGHIEPK